MTQVIELVSNSEAETEAVGARLGSVLQRGDLLALDGDVGAGKTALVRGVAAGLKVDAMRVRSPTFALHHVYAGRPPLHHLDCYRLGPGAGLELLDIDALLEEGVVAIEWAEYADLSAYTPLRLRLETVALQRRRLLLQPGGPERVGAALRAVEASP